MAMTPSRILIVGCGPGSKKYVSPAAAEAVYSADVLLGSRRLLDLFGDFAGPTIPWHAGTADMLRELEQALAAGQTPAVLVSGDPGLFSLAQQIVQRFGTARCHIVPAVSSVQVAFARLGLSWVDARIISAHGRNVEVEPGELARHDKIAILAGTDSAMAFCARAAQALQSSHVAFLCENLTLDNEAVRQVDVDAVAACGASSLSIVILVRKELIV